MNASRSARVYGGLVVTLLTRQLSSSKLQQARLTALAKNRLG